MRRFNRREFINLAAGAAVTLGAGRLLGGCGHNNGADLGTQVAAVRGDDLIAMTRQVLDRLGGIGTIVKPGETVFIKPNFVTLPYGHIYDPCAYGECTKPEILVALAEACLQAGASKVAIGDGSQMPEYDLSNAVYLDGSTNLVQEVERLRAEYDNKVSAVCLETESPSWEEVPSDTMGTIKLSSWCFVDRVISVPVAKTHVHSHVSLSIKNFIGATSLYEYGQFVPDLEFWVRGLYEGTGISHESPTILGQICLDMIAAIQPDLTIIDFSVGLEGDGPQSTGANANPVDMKDRLGSWLLLASTDPIAADATTARVMSMEPTDIEQCAIGAQRGLGVIGEGEIEILGERLEDLQVTWKPANLINVKRSVRSPYHRCPYSKGKKRSL
jgi:uncharacterized protein (DUF362 family)